MNSCECCQFGGSRMLCSSRMISPAFHWLTGYFPFTGAWSTLMNGLLLGPSRCVKMRQPSLAGATTFQ